MIKNFSNIYKRYKISITKSFYEIFIAKKLSRYVFLYRCFPYALFILAVKKESNYSINRILKYLLLYHLLSLLQRSFSMDFRSPDIYAHARPYTHDYANIHPLHHSCNVSFPRRFPSRVYPHGWSASDFIIVAVHETNISHALSRIGERTNCRR